MAQIHRLRPGEGARYRAIRLAALADAPDAFGSTLASALDRPEDHWDQDLAAIPMWVATHGGRDLGMVRAALDDDDPARAWLLGMWVHPQARGSGAGDQLVAVAQAWCRVAGAGAIHLDVADTNLPAQGLYRRHGFAPDGTTGHLPPPREHVSEHRMVCPLPPLALGCTWRWAAAHDLPALEALMNLAIDTLQAEFLDPAQVRASHAIMGLDSQLVHDGTYVRVARDGALAGCGGWSRRATLYGGDATSGRDARLLDPRTEAARVRAMYTHPAHVRCGIGRMVLALCEAAAWADGFQRVELMATMAGVPLYEAAGYLPLDQPVQDDRGGVAVPLVRMGKSLGLPGV